MNFQILCYETDAISFTLPAIFILCLFLPELQKQMLKFASIYNCFSNFLKVT